MTMLFLFKKKSGSYVILDAEFGKKSKEIPRRMVFVTNLQDGCLGDGEGRGAISKFRPYNYQNSLEI